MSKKITIKEQDRNRILKLYGLSEQAQPQQGKPQQVPQQDQQPTQSQVQGQNLVTKIGDDSFNLDLTGTWKPGYYSSSSFQSPTDLQKKLDEMFRWVIKKGVKDFTINIEVSESQVTNYDLEGFDNQRTEESKLPKGELSKRRGMALRNYIMGLQQYRALIKNKYNIKINVTPKIGKTPYPGKQPNDPAYQKDIYAKVIVKLQKPITCLLNGEITVYHVKDHQCDAALFNFYINNVNLGVVNLNNSNGDVGFGNSNANQIKNYYDLNAKLINQKYGKNLTGDQLAKEINGLVSKFQLKTVNRRVSDRERGGYRSNTFTLTPQILSQIAPQGTEKLEFSLEPLVVAGSEFYVFDHITTDTTKLRGPHLETPSVKITLNKKLVIDTPIGTAVGGVDKLTPSKTVVMVTDLCGVPLTQKATTS